MATVKERLTAMDDFQVVRFFEAFAQQLMASSRTSFEAVQEGVPGSTRTLSEWQAIESLTPDQAGRLVAPKEAAAVARKILLHLADDPVYGPALSDFLTSYRDDALVAEVILAVGLVASVLMMVASTAFKAKFGSVEIEKHTLDANTIKTILEPFGKVLSPAK
jgi:hypothetical protein